MNLNKDNSSKNLDYSIIDNTKEDDYEYIIDSMIEDRPVTSDYFSTCVEKKDKERRFHSSSYKSHAACCGVEDMARKRRHGEIALIYGRL